MPERESQRALITRIRTFAIRHRRGVTAALLALAVLAGLNAVAGAHPTVATVVATRDIPLGTTLTFADLRVARVSADAVPVPNPDVTQVVGRPSVIAVHRGQPVPVEAVFSREQLRSDEVAVPIRLADSEVLGLVRVGQHVDVVGHQSTQDPATVLARGARIVTIAAAKTTGLLRSSQEASDIVIAVPTWQATAVAAASLAAPVALLLRD